MSDSLTRREFMKHSALAGAAAAAGLSAAGAAKAGEAAAKAEVAKAAPSQVLSKPLPTIKLGSLDVSRFILGSNPFWGYSHKSPALDEEMKKFHTDEKIVEALDEAARCGVTTIASPPEERWVNLFKKYREGGGKLRLWIGQCHGPPEQMKEEIDRAIKGGAVAIFIQGGRVEQQFQKGAFDTLKAWLEQIKAAGLPAGLAAHWPEVLPEVEKRGLPTDFYYQCCYNVSKGATFRSEEREKAMEVILGFDKKPVVAYKILGAGRLSAEEGFTYAFNRIRRKDGVCVGIYMKDAVDQIRENSTLTEILTKA